MATWRGVKKQQGDKIWYVIQNRNPLDNTWIDHFWPVRDTEEGIQTIVKRLNTPPEPIITTILE